MAAVTGPVYDAAHTQPSIGPGLIGEVIGLLFVYAAVIGNIRQIPSKPSRILNLLIFGSVGLAIFFGAFIQVRDAGAGSTVGIVMALVVVLALISFEFARWIKFRSADSWSVTQGTIENLEVKEVCTRSTHYFVVDVAYSYSVNGEYFSGRFSQTFETESEASDYSQSLKSRPLSLRYKPTNVEISSPQLQ